MKKIARNLREAPDEKRLPNRRLQRSVLVVYVSGSDCAAWAAVSTILPLVLLISLAYISGGGGGKSCALSSLFFTFDAFHYKALLPKVPLSCVIKLLIFFGVSGLVVHGSH